MRATAWSTRPPHSRRSPPDAGRRFCDHGARPRAGLFFGAVSLERDCSRVVEDHETQYAWARRLVAWCSRLLADESGGDRAAADPDLRPDTSTTNETGGVRPCSRCSSRSVRMRRSARASPLGRREAAHRGGGHLGRRIARMPGAGHDVHAGAGARSPGPGRCCGDDASLSRGHAEHLRALPAGARAGTFAARSDLSRRCRRPTVAVERELDPAPKENAPGISPRGA